MLCIMYVVGWGLRSTERGKLKTLPMVLQFLSTKMEATILSSLERNLV
jgi:hypothetical protein